MLDLFIRVIFSIVLSIVVGSMGQADTLKTVDSHGLSLSSFANLNGGRYLIFCSHEPGKESCQSFPILNLEESRSFGFTGEKQQWDLFLNKCIGLEHSVLFSDVSQSIVTIALLWNWKPIAALIAGVSSVLVDDAITIDQEPEPIAYSLVVDNIESIRHALAPSTRVYLKTPEMMLLIYNILSTCSWHMEDWIREEGSKQCMSGCHSHS